MQSGDNVIPLKYGMYDGDEKWLRLFMFILRERMQLTDRMQLNHSKYTTVHFSRKTSQERRV
jgi:hypothetical protein